VHARKTKDGDVLGRGIASQFSDGRTGFGHGLQLSDDDQRHPGIASAGQL